MQSKNTGTNTASVLKRAPWPDEAEEQRSTSVLTPQQIRERAFEIHIERGGIHGMDLDDWMQAERELQEEYKNNEGGAKNK